MKVKDLIDQLKNVNPETEVRFSESYVSEAFGGDRLPCGPDEGTALHYVVTVSGSSTSRVLIYGDVMDSLKVLSKVSKCKHPPDKLNAAMALMPGERAAQLQSCSACGAWRWTPNDWKHPDILMGK